MQIYIIIKVSCELAQIEKVAITIASDNTCFPGNDDDDSFKLAYAACQSKIEGLSKAQYINGLLKFFESKVDSSDPRLRPCGPLVGVKKLAQRIGRQNALSLVTDFLNSSHSSS